MNSYIAEFDATEARGYIPQEQDSIRQFIQDSGHRYDSLDDLLTAWTRFGEGEPIDSASHRSSSQAGLATFRHMVIMR